VTDEPEPEGPREERRKERLRVLDLSAVGLAFPIAMLLGYFAGRKVGGWLGSAQVGSMIGLGLGIAGGFYNLYKMVSRLAPRGGGRARGQGSKPRDDAPG
jgi:hypothetical protein